MPPRTHLSRRQGGDGKGKKGRVRLFREVDGGKKRLRKTIRTGRAGMARSVTFSSLRGPILVEYSKHLAGHIPPQPSSPKNQTNGIHLKS